METKTECLYCENSKRNKTIGLVECYCLESRDYSYIVSEEHSCPEFQLDEKINRICEKERIKHG